MSVIRLDRPRICKVPTQEECVSRFVSRGVENLLIGFAGPTRRGLDRLFEPSAAEQVRERFDKVARRRAVEEVDGCARRLASRASYPSWRRLRDASHPVP